MYDKKIFIIIFYLVILASCTSVNGGSDGLVLEHQKQITELETRNRELEQRLAEYNNVVNTSVRRLEDISRRAGTMETTVDEVINLFDEYQQEVKRLIHEHNSIQTKD